jgi:hypothetical protein
MEVVPAEDFVVAVFFNVVDLNDFVVVLSVSFVLRVVDFGVLLTFIVVFVEALVVDFLVVLVGGFVEVFVVFVVVFIGVFVVAFVEVLEVVFVGVFVGFLVVIFVVALFVVVVEVRMVVVVFLYFLQTPLDSHVSNLAVIFPNALYM